MISRITGVLSAIYEDHIVLNVGFLGLDVQMPECTRRQLTSMLNHEISLFTIFYIDGNPTQGKLTPRLVGFQTETEREFFELFCSVDGLGAKKALKAMTCPVSEVAFGIESQDAAFLSTLPGIGAATAERIIAKLRRKVARFSVAPRDETVGAASGIFTEAFEALMALGHSESDARRKLESLSKKRKKFTSVQEILEAVYHN
ncbi:MAG: Holliday junction branch migration protein RuvA [Planctomycetia bacterium]|nr:Holliday junction branch migration protein RuvA [Planctomycetia bacterium]